MNLIETGHQQVNADGDPNLSPHGVLRGSVEGFDAQVLLDPLEEEFDLPPPLVDGGDCKRRQIEVVGQEDQSFPCVSIEEADTSQFTGIVAFTFFSAQSDDLIATQASGLIDWLGLANVEPCVAFRSDDKVGVGAFDPVESGEVEVSPVKDIDAPRLNAHLIHEVDVMHRTVRDLYEDRDRAGQVDLGMEFYRGFGLAEMSPRKHRQAQIYGGGIDSINHLVDVQSIGVCAVKAPGLADENLCERFVNAPVPVLVGISQISPCDVATDAHGVEMRASPQAGFNVTQTLPESDLGKSHRKKLIAGSHALTRPRHRVELHATIELLAVDEIGNLSENKMSRVHPLLRMNKDRNGQPVQMRHTHFSSLAA